MFKLWCAVVIFVLLFGAVLSINHPVSAQAEQEEPKHDPIECGKYLVNECQVLTTEEVAALKEGSDFWGIYISDKNGTYKYKGDITRVPNPAEWGPFGLIDKIPSEVHIRRDSFTSLPQMGISWANGQLTVTNPGYLLEGEIYTPLPPKGGVSVFAEDKISTPDWKNFTTIESSSWDGGKILTWEFVPQVTENEMILHIFYLYVGFLEPVDVLPHPTEYEYTEVASVDWIPGEDLEVISVNTNARHIPLTWEETWDWLDVAWMYDYEYEQFIEAGFTEDQANQSVRLIYEADRQEFSGIYPNYRNTKWTATIEWVDNVEIKKRDGSVYRIKNDHLYAWKACEEGCSSTSYTPNVNEHMFVDPYTFWNIETDIIANLWTTNVDPARQILEKDQNLLDMRLAVGEVTVELSVVTGIYDMDWDNDGNVDSKLIDTNNGPIDLPIHYLPPIGTAVYVYTYTTSSTQDHSNWDVMALVDAREGLWYFNSEAEYGNGFNAKAYNIGN